MTNATPTEWALKYGAKDALSLDSGLTSTEPLFLSGQILTEGDGNIPMRDKLHEQFRRENFKSFTRKELIDMEVITVRKLKPGNLTNKIVPSLSRKRLDDGTRVHKVPLDSQRLFTAHEPLVWKVLELVLVLASRILVDSVMTPFIRPPCTWATRQENEQEQTFRDRLAFQTRRQQKPRVNPPHLQDEQSRPSHTKVVSESDDTMKLEKVGEAKFTGRFKAGLDESHEEFLGKGNSSHDHWSAYHSWVAARKSGE